jgi:protein dpy-30
MTDTKDNLPSDAARPEPAAPAEAVAATSEPPAADAQPPPPVFPLADAAKKAEEVAKKAAAEPHPRAVPNRKYLEQTVVPILMQGMQQLVKVRPEDPVEYLAAYLLKHNPKSTAPEGT